MSVQSCFKSSNHRIAPTSQEKANRYNEAYNGNVAYNMVRISSALLRLNNESIWVVNILIRSIVRFEIPKFSNFKN